MIYPGEIYRYLKMRYECIGVLVFYVFFAGPQERRIAAAEEAPPSIDEWKKAVAGVLDDLRHTIRRRDQAAFSRQLADLIQKGAAPRKGFIAELRSLIGIASPGVVLNSVVKKLIEEARPEAVQVLFDALSRRDYRDVRGQELGETETEVRRRVIEYYLLRLSDERFRKDPPEPPLAVPAELEKALVAELSSADPRRVRCAAYLLAAGESKGAVTALAEALGKWGKSPLTQAALVDALARSDAAGAAAEIESAADARSEIVRLAAIPWLGRLKSQKAEGLIQKCLEAPRWSVRRAAVEACQTRGDRFAMDLLMARFPKEGPRLQSDILRAMLDLTNNVLPPDPRDWPKWWKMAREDFRPGPQKKYLQDEKGKTVLANLQYFGFEVSSNQLAIVLDISGSMASSNLNLGKSGVMVAGALKEGSPLAIAKDQIKGLLKKAGTRMQFNIIAYSDQVKPFSKGIVSASQQNLQQAFRFVDGLKADGGTNVYGGLMAAFADESVDTIYLVSDGEPTDGPRTEPDDILEAIISENRFRKTRINTIQLGEDQELMRELADSSGGKYRLLEVGPGVK